MKTILRFLRDNSLSLAFAALFVLCLLGQAVSYVKLGAEDPRSEERVHDIFAAMTSGEVLRGVLGNWQAALLQLLTLIVFAVFLRQRGASHSRKPEEEKKKEERRHKEASARGLVHRPASWLYRNSLSLAFAVLFAATFAAFFFADLAVYNQQRLRTGEAAFTAGRFALSARLWFDVLQTWQAEFFAMAVFLVLTIFLRQDNSAESKPVWAPDEQTGGTNE